MSVNKQSQAQQSPAAEAQSDADPDLTRAKQLVDLHHKVKVLYRNNGVDEDLLQARRAVEGVSASLGGKS